MAINNKHKQQLYKNYNNRRQDFLFAVHQLTPNNSASVVDVELAIKCSYNIPDDISAFQAAESFVDQCKSPTTRAIPGDAWIHESNKILTP